MDVSGVSPEVYTPIADQDINQSQDFGASPRGEYSDGMIDTGRVFTYKHLSGEVVTGNLLDMDRCVVMGRVALKDRDAAAELYVMSQQLNEEQKEDIEETEEAETEDSSEPEARKTQEPGHKTEKDNQSRTGGRHQEGRADGHQPVGDAETTRPDQAALERKPTNYPRSSQAHPSPGMDVQVIKSAEVNRGSRPPIARAKQPIPADLTRNTNRAVMPTAVKTAAAGKMIPALVSTAEPVPKKIAKTALELTAEPTPAAAGIEAPEITVNILHEAEEPLNLAMTETLGAEFAAEDNQPGIDLSPHALVANDNESVHGRLLSDSPEAVEITGPDLSEAFISTNEDGRTLTFIEQEPIWSEIAPQPDLPFQEIEKTLTLVTQRIEALEDGQSEDVNELLDQIAQKLEAAGRPAEDNSENPKTGLQIEAAEEEFRDLLTQLFEELEIEYTPESVESFAGLALEGNLTELVAKDKKEAAGHKDKGTHEVIKKLLAVVNKAKRTVLYAYHLGRSAVHLYAQGFAQARPKFAAKATA